MKTLEYLKGHWDRLRNILRASERMGQKALSFKSKSVNMASAIWV